MTRQKTPWLMVHGNRLIRGRSSNPPAKPEEGRAVVLRGVNLSGMQYAQFQYGPPRTHYLEPGAGGQVSTLPQKRWWESAGITQYELQELAVGWKATVVRLPINEEYVLRGLAPPGESALAGDEYLKDLDQIIEWAAKWGMYTLLALHTLYVLPAGPPYKGKGYNAPMPDASRKSGADKDEDTKKMWATLAARYKDDPAVLFDLFNEPHQPGKDEPAYKLPRDRKDWVGYWKEWVVTLEQTIHAQHPDAVIFVSGIGGPRWAVNLRSMPVTTDAGPIPNAVYSTHVYWQKGEKPKGKEQAASSDYNPLDQNGVLPGTTCEQEWNYWFGLDKLRLNHPVFVAEWGICDYARCTHPDCVKNQDPDEKRNWRDWCNRLEAYFRRLHRYQRRDGAEEWQGLAGWTAWAWGDHPHIVMRRWYDPRTGKDEFWFVRHGSPSAPQDHVPTEFGSVVKTALGRQVP